MTASKYKNFFKKECRSQRQNVTQSAQLCGLTRFKKNTKKMLTFARLSSIINLACEKDGSQTTAVLESLSRRNYISGCGSAWLERLIWDQEVAGSNPVTPTLRV